VPTFRMVAKWYSTLCAFTLALNSTLAIVSQNDPV